MKITPITVGGQPTTNYGGVIGSSGSDRIERAKSIAMGEGSIQPSDTPVDPAIQQAEQNIRRIKMKVNQSPDRPIEMPGEAEALTSTEPQSAISTNNESVVSEETKPLSPQFAALAKQRRSLQVKERELAEREKALQANSGGNDLAAQLKSQPLKVLQEQGVLTPEFYNSFTEFLVSGQSGINPEVQSLKEEIKSLKEGFDKRFTDRDTQAEQQALSEMRKEADFLSRDGEAFELVRETGSVPVVIDLIHRNYKQTGEVLDVKEAMQLVEDELLEKNLKIAQLKKIQAKYAPQQEQVELQSQPKQIKTLTNRDTANVPLDRKERARLVFNGLLKGR